MAKQRKGISKALRKGKVESAYQMPEGDVDESGFGSPKTKEKSIIQSAKEQDEFNQRYGFAADVNSKNYDNSKGEVPEEYDRAINSWSDYRMVPKMRQEDQSDNVKSSSGKPIPGYVNYTMRDADRSDKVYNNGFNVVSMLRKKGYDSGTIYDESDRPTLDNPDGKGLNPKYNENPESALQNALAPKTIQDEAIQDASKTQSDNLVLDQIQNAKTIDEAQQTKDLANTARKEELAEKSTTLNSFGNLLSLMSEEDKKKYGDSVQAQFNAQADRTENETPTNQVIGAVVSNDPAKQPVNPNTVLGNQGSEVNVGQQAPYPAAAQVISTVNGQQAGQRPAFDQLPNAKQQVENGLINSFRAMNQQTPGLVVEKLGIQDYYPDISRNIAVGNFSGSRIGSQTIYSGVGGLLPMGLYDARKRAISEAAQKKQAAMQKLLEVPDAPEQFNTRFKQSAANEIYDILGKYNYDVNAIMKDRDAMNQIYRLQNLSKEMAYVDGLVDETIELANPKDGAPGAYIPEDVLQAMQQYREGKLDVDKIVNGEISVLDQINKIKAYANGTAWIDKNLSEWKSDPTKLPISFKDGRPMTQENVQKAQDYLKRVKNSTDYDSYMTIVKSEFQLDPEVVDAWIEENMVGATDEQKEKQKETLNKYLFSQMPDPSIEATVKDLNNKNFERYKFAEEGRREEKRNETIITRAITNANAQNIKSVIGQIANSNMNQTEKEAAMMNAYRNAGFTPVKNNATGQIYGRLAYGGTGSRKENFTFTSDNSEVYVQNRTTKKMEWVRAGVALANKDKYQISADQLAELEQFRRGSAIGTVSETRVFETYTKDGNQIRVGVNNAKDYANSDDKAMMMEVHGNLYIKEGVDANGNPKVKPTTLKVRSALNPEKSTTDRATLDAIYTEETQNLGTDPGYNVEQSGTSFK
jgi:hypothetical protein